MTGADCLKKRVERVQSVLPIDRPHEHRLPTPILREPESETLDADPPEPVAG
jgi:hypothetical protein